jgi:hypothetical protein
MNVQVSSNETNVLHGVRNSATWPRHKTKAKARKARRVAVARAAQNERDAKRGGQ